MPRSSVRPRWPYLSRLGLGLGGARALRRGRWTPLHFQGPSLPQVCSSVCVCLCVCVCVCVCVCLYVSVGFVSCACARFCCVCACSVESAMVGHAQLGS